MTVGVASALIPINYTQVTSLSSAAGLGTVPADTRVIQIQAETQSVRYRDDGTNPTSSVGQVLSAGDTLWYDGAKPASLKFIETTASAKLNVTFYK